jgi:endonuclease/exonuclease/phosphatase family metal-dependent hydrolase
MAWRRRPCGAAPVVTATQTGDVAPRLVIATYNVHTCVGIDHRYDPPRTAEVLRELGADIIGLQEVDAGHRHGTHLDQWLFFSEATGFDTIRGANLIDHRGRFGNAILTRFPVLDVRHADLSVPGREPRGAIDADLAIEGKVLRVIATHLGLNAAERRLQSRRIVELVAKVPGRRDGLIILGDLNEWRGRRGGIRTLERRLGSAPAPRTFPSWAPVLRLDRIYASQGASVARASVHRSALAKVASDHLPLRATIDWPAIGVANRR